MKIPGDCKHPVASDRHMVIWTKTTCNRNQQNPPKKGEVLGFKHQHSEYRYSTCNEVRGGFAICFDVHPNGMMVPFKLLKPLARFNMMNYH